MSEIKCQCGHKNPFGTVLCERCGRPQTEEAKESKLVDMRYEGSARRSQTYKRSIIDRIWNFFSSVKIGISIIIAVLSNICNRYTLSTKAICSQREQMQNI